MHVLLYRNSNNTPLKKLPNNLHYLLLNDNINIITYG
jgi:hypothetical protein